MADMKKLPVGNSTFSDIRESNYAYVDKTALITQLLEYKYYFLSRPRRFGRTLLLSTIQELFSGHKELFKGLAAYDRWDFPTHPVIHMNLALGVVRNGEDLHHRLEWVIEDNAQRLGVEVPESPNVSSRFSALIASTKEKYQKRVVVLVDEYDKPLIDNLSTDSGQEIYRDLCGFYSVIKAHDANLRFVLLSGVSNITMATIFGGLNNLNDITLNPQFSALCGFTQSELEETFAPWLENQDLAAIKQWYNGYSWGGEKVYNPFSILLFFNQHNGFYPHWLETGTPSFLMRYLEKEHPSLPPSDNLIVRGSDLKILDISRLRLETLLFQTGYLTLAEVESSYGESQFHLDFPNRETRLAFDHLVRHGYLRAGEQ
jgi:hypothetical protein